MKNLQNALPVQQFTGPTASGGYWNDGSLMLTPVRSPSDVFKLLQLPTRRILLTHCCAQGMGCSTAANCMSADRFQSMYAIWTIMSFNLLLVGDFSKLNEFVMGTWTNVSWALSVEPAVSACQPCACIAAHGIAERFVATVANHRTGLSPSIKTPWALEPYALTV